MKRSLMFALLMLSLIMLPNTTQASQPTFSGTESIQFRDDDNHINPEKTGSGFIDTLLLDCKLPADEHFSIYARLGAQWLSKTDFGRDFADYQQDQRFVAQLDQFGLIYSNAGYTYKVGRQSASVGFTGLLYDNTDDIGLHSFVDGISMETTKGKLTVRAIAAQEDNEGKIDNRLYAVSGLLQCTNRLALGATLAKYIFADSTPDTSHYAMYVSYKINKLLLHAEHAQTPSKSSMTGHNLGASYQMDFNNKVYVITHKTEPNADINGKTAFDHDEKGYYYGFEHKFDKNTQLDLFYKDNLRYFSTVKNTSFQVTFKHRF